MKNERTHRIVPRALACGLLLTVALSAQSALYYDFGASCPNPSGSRAHVAATLPVPGWPLTWTVTGDAYRPALLLLSPQVNWGGVDLTPFGFTGCRGYLGGSPIALGVTLGGTGAGTYTMSVPWSIPAGIYVHGQAAVLAPGANPAGFVTSEVGVAKTGSEPDLTVGEIRAFAPLVRIHPGEAYFPMDPLDFVRLSRFRHHRSFLSDQGYNKATQSWVTTNSTAPEYYGVPVAFVNSYGLNGDGTNRRPRDSNSGSSWNVFLQPVGAPAGDRYPNGSVPAFYHYRRSGSVHEVQYWWFMGYNDAPATINHQGDWEHVTVRVVQRQIVGVHFASHNSGTYYQSSQLSFSAGRPIVYMAKGTHASYPSAGSFYYGIDQTSNGGYQWNISLALASLGAQPWRDYAGAWGEVGSTATTTGPLGPWHKRFDP